MDDRKIDVESSELCGRSFRQNYFLNSMPEKEKSFCYINPSDRNGMGEIERYSRHYVMASSANAPL